MFVFFLEVRIALKVLFRARFLSFLFWLSVLLITLVLMAAQFSARQPQTVGLDVGISFVRLALPFLSVFWLQELLSREIDRKYFLISMAYPRPRYLYFLARAVAVFVLLFSVLTILAGLLAVVVHLVGQSYMQSTPVSLGKYYWLTIAFLGLDLGVVAAMGALLAVVAVTPSFVLIGMFGFMVAARSFSPIVALLASDGSLVRGGDAYKTSLDFLGYVLPDLAALDVRMAALYGQGIFIPDDWVVRVVSVVVYGAALLLIAIWAQSRKQFV